MFTAHGELLLQGNIVEWKKKEGDELASGDILCMVETDKVCFQSVLPLVKAFLCHMASLGSQCQLAVL